MTMNFHTSAFRPAVRSIPGIWVHTTLDSFDSAADGLFPSFLSESQQARLERLRQARLLFDGRHRAYFLDEGRTQFDFPRVRTAGGQVKPLYLTYNVLGLISLKGADLLFGREPLLRAEDPAHQSALSSLAERCGLHPLLYGCAVDASYEGECFLEAQTLAGEAYLRQVPADEVFPIGDVQPNGQYDAYVRYRLKNVGTVGAPVNLLLEVMYLPGRIERRCFQLDANERRETGLEAWTGTEGPSLLPLILTGVPFPTIIWIPNLLARGNPVSDYDGAIELQDALNAKNSQVGRVLLKHSDPRMAFPEEAFDEEGNIRSDHDVFAFADPKRLPKYITWDAELQHAMADRQFVLNQLLVRTETSPALLGLKEGAAPDAYKKVRLESFNSLAKAARKAAYWRAGIRRALTTALALEATTSGITPHAGPIAVQLRDGIPIDDKEQADRLAVLRGAGLISVERALEEQLQDPAAVQKELTRLNAS